MSRTQLIEGALVLIIGLIAALEGIRLAIQPKAPWMIYDAVGPGLYLLALSIGLLIVGIAHIISQYRKNQSRRNVLVEGTSRNPSMKMQLLVMIAAQAVYIALIDIIGYAPASVVFFLMEFRIVGIKSWPLNLLLSLGLATIYYVVFITFCDLVFPQPMLFR